MRTKRQFMRLLTRKRRHGLLAIYDSLRIRQFGAFIIAKELYFSTLKLVNKLVVLRGFREKRKPKKSVSVFGQVSPKI